MAIVITEDHGAVRHIVMNRAEKRNAMNRELIGGLAEALQRAAADTSVRCVVVRGEGPMFSSGMDAADLKGLSDEPHRLREVRAGLLATWNLCEEMTKPTIAQIHGGCIGGAMELA
ncbi:MAG: enoyl-CoA hydratase/isomerase family protein, partial [Solirubrobacteraceae bacterium]